MRMFPRRLFVPAAFVLAAGAIGICAWHRSVRQAIPNSIAAPANSHTPRPLPLPFVLAAAPQPMSELRAENNEAPPTLLDTSTASDWFEPTKYDQLLSLLLQWAEHQPQAAAAYIEKVPNKLRMSVQQELAGAVMAQSPLIAMTLLTELPQDRIVDQMLRQSAMEYASIEPVNALNWARQQPDEDTQTLLLGGVLCEMANHHPTTAAEGLYELPEGPDQEVVVVEVVQRWAQKNAPEAGAFVAKLLENVAVSAAENLIAAWAAEDPDASLRWAAELQLPQIREAATAAWRHATSYPKNSQPAAD